VNWLTDYRIPIGPWAKIFVDWLTTSGGWFFDQLAFILSNSIKAMLFLLQSPHPLIVVAVITALAYWLRRSVGITALTAFGLLFIINQGYWKETTETLALVLASTGVSMVVGRTGGTMSLERSGAGSAMALRTAPLPLDQGPIYRASAPVLVSVTDLEVDVAAPTAEMRDLFGLTPAEVRLAAAMFEGQTLNEAAQAFGATPGQVLRKVELPYATPQIMAGLTQTIMLSLSMVVIAALVGANGLGVPVVRALNTVNVAKGFEAGLCIVILAIILDRMFRASDAGDGA